jgi:predicted CXXCH cytochrome family protein
MYHRLVEDGFAAQFPVKYQIGGGMLGGTFLVQVRNHLFESPVSWFNGYGWDVSPGYAEKNFIGFDRAVTQPCLFCHVNRARFDDRDGRHLVSKELHPIGCERCHGPGEEHSRHPTPNNIVNPAKLEGAVRDSVCEQCHLEGADRVLNPGRNWNDFRPGERTEAVFATYVVTGSDSKEVAPASEVEQLAESRCAQASHGKLWCGSCHNPHRARVPRQQEIKAVCTSCHRKLAPAAHRAGLTECTSCHMPTTNQTTITHASHTDHRILRNPKLRPAAGTEEQLVAWREPGDTVRQRDLAMGELMLSPLEHDQLRRNGADLLLSLGDQSLDHDPEAVSALQLFYLQSRNLAKAVEFGRLSTKLNSQSATTALNYAIALDGLGQKEEAERQYLRAIDIDPSLKDAYGRLAISYANRGRYQDATKIIDRYLRWNPDEILFHAAKKRLAAEEGEEGAPQ